jgi:hypothetical protein
VIGDVGVRTDEGALQIAATTAEFSVQNDSELVLGIFAYTARKLLGRSALGVVNVIVSLMISTRSIQQSDEA